MWKVIVIVSLIGGPLLANSNRRVPLDMSKYTESEHRTIRHHKEMTTPRGIVYVDSALNQYGFWTSMHDPIKGSGDTVVLCFRCYGDGTLGSGALGLAWTFDGGVGWMKDWPVNDGLLNDPHPGVYDARYPSAGFHPDFPY